MSAKDDGCSEEFDTQKIELVPNLARAPQTPTLQVVRGPRVGAVYPINSGSLVVGRGPQADLQLNDSSMSRLHARFTCSGGALLVTDMSSLNGTFVEGARIAAPRELKQGDRVRVGNVLLRYITQEPQELHASNHLYESAVRDHLTGLFNRGYFMEQLATELAIARRRQLPMALLLLDVDHFKAINDTHGHPVGDRMLQQVADQLKGGLRSEDLAARIGGEEFAILLREMDPDAALIIAERLRIRTRLASVRTAERGEVRITSSVGVAALSKKHRYADVDELMAAADEALYDAKRGGRDRVVVHEPDEHTVVRLSR